MGFSQALSGLNAAASSLDVQGNNIANSQTVGFKSSSAQFADVFANSKIGLGTRMSTVLQDFGEGNLESTGRNLDLGISGEGFFRFSQNDQVVYSRNGQLSMTADGYLQNAQGARIMGFGAVAGEVQAGGQPDVLQIGTEELEANATEAVSSVMNLDSRESIGEGVDTARLKNADGENVDVDYHFSSNFTVYDSLGNPINTSVYYEKVGGPESQNVWQAKVAADGQYDESNDFLLEFGPNGELKNVREITDEYLDSKVAYQSAEDDVVDATQVRDSAQEAFDEAVADGYAAGSDEYDDAETALNDAKADLVAKETTRDTAETTMINAFNAQPTSDQKEITFDVDTGADPIVFDYRPEGTTQFGNTSRTTDLQQDGYTSGAFVGISIEADGTIMSNFSNEQSVAAGQIAMANFRNPEGLRPEGDNAWSATQASGQELVGAPGTGLLGSIESGAIEASNVDMARELVDMIVTQRAYQANSQTIKTQDEVLQTAINLR